jgi:hypothetical protein
MHALDLEKARASKEAHGSASSSSASVSHASSEWSTESTELAALCVEINAAELNWSAPVIAAARAKAHIYFETHLEAQKAQAAAQRQEQGREIASSGGVDSVGAVENVTSESGSGWGAWLGSKLWSAAAADNSENSSVDSTTSSSESDGFRSLDFSRKALLEATHINADEYETNEEWVCPEDWPLVQTSLTIGAVSATLLDYASAHPSDDTGAAFERASGTEDSESSLVGEVYEALARVDLSAAEVSFTRRPTSWDSAAALGSLHVADARQGTAAAFPYLLRPLAADYARPKGTVRTPHDFNSSCDGSDVDHELGTHDDERDDGTHALDLYEACLRLHVASNPTLAPAGTPEAESLKVQLAVAPFQAVHAPSGLWVDVKRILAGRSHKRPQSFRSPFGGSHRQNIVADDSNFSEDCSDDGSNPDEANDKDLEEGSLSLRMAQWRDRQARALFASMIAHGTNIHGSGNGDSIGNNSGNDLSSGGRLCVSVDWAAPLVVVPENAFDMSGAAVIIDLGHFKLRSVNEVIVQHEQSFSHKCAEIEPLKVSAPTRSVDSEDEFEDANGEFDDEEGDIEEDAPMSEKPHASAGVSSDSGGLDNVKTTSIFNNVGENDARFVSKGRLLGWRCTLSDMAVLTTPSLQAAQSSDDGNNDFLVGATLEPCVERFSVVVNLSNTKSCSEDIIGTANAHSPNLLRVTEEADTHRGINKIIPCVEATVTLPLLRIALRTTTYKRLLCVHSAALRATTKHAHNVLRESTQNGEEIDSDSTGGAHDSSSSDYEELRKESAANNKGSDVGSMWRVKFAAPLVLLDLRTEEPSTLGLRESISRHMPATSSETAAGRFPGDNVSVPLVRLRLEGLSGELASSEHNKRTVLTAALRKIEVTDDLQVAGPTFAKLLTTAVQQQFSSTDPSQVVPVDLMSVRVSTSPWGKYMALSLNSIFVQWNPETLIAIHDFLQRKNDQMMPEITPRLSRSLSSPRAQRLARKKSEGSADSDTDKLDGSQVPGTTEVTEIVNKKISGAAPHMLVEVSLRSVTVSFNREGCAAHLCEARLDDAKAFYFKPGFGDEENASKTFTEFYDITKDNSTGSGLSRGDIFGGGIRISTESSSSVESFRKLMWGDTRVSGTLGNFTLTDVSTPGTRYREILGLQRTSGQQIEKDGQSTNSASALPHGSSLVQFSYSMFGGQRAQRLGFGSALDMEMSPVRLCYVQQYWLEIWDYMFSAVLVGSVLGAGSARAQPALPAPVSTEPQEYVPAFQYGDLRHRRRLRVKFNSPVLVLPAHPLASAHLELDLGTWHLENYYVWTDPNTGDPLSEVCTGEDDTAKVEALAPDGTPLAPPRYSHAEAMDRHHFSISVSHVGVASVDARAPDNVASGKFAATAEVQRDAARKATNDVEDFFDAFDAFESDAFNDTVLSNGNDGNVSHPDDNVDNRDHVSNNRRARPLMVQRARLSVDVSWAADGRPVCLPGRPHHYHVTVVVPSLLVELQHADYTLIRRILDFNVGALPRVPLHRLGTGTAAVFSPGTVVDQTTEEASLPTTHVQFGYDAQSGPPSTYNMAVSMETVCVGFATDDGDPLTQLQIAGMSYALKQSLPNDNSGSTRPQLVLSETDVKCQSIEIHDRRHYASPRAFTSLMRPLRARNSRREASSENSSSSDELGSNKSPNSDMPSSFDNVDTVVASPTLWYRSVATAGVGVESHLTISEACIYHLPGAFKDLGGFCAYEAWPDDALSAACVARRRRRDRSQPSSECFEPVFSAYSSDGVQPAVPAKAPPGPHSSFHVTIKSPHYVLVDDVCNSESAALVVRLNEFIAVQSTADPSRIESSWQVRVSDLEVTQVPRALEPTDLGVSGTQHPLFTPTYLRLDADTVKRGSSDDAKSTGMNDSGFDRTATLTLGPLCARTGVNDAALSFRIMSSLARNDGVDPPLTFYKAPCPVDAVSPLRLEAARLASMLNAAGGSNTPSQDSPRYSAPSIHNCCFLECAEVSAVLVDDTVEASGDVVLLKASLDGVKAALDDASDDTNFESDGSGFGNNNNNSMRRYEAENNDHLNEAVDDKCQRLSFEVAALRVDDLLVTDPVSPFRRVLATTLADAAPVVESSTDFLTAGNNGNAASSISSNSGGDNPNATKDPLLAVNLLRFSSGTQQVSIRLNVLEAAWHPTLVRRLHRCYLAFLSQSKRQHARKDKIDVASLTVTETSEQCPPGKRVRSTDGSEDNLLSSPSNVRAALEVNVSIVALRLRLDKESEQRALLWVTLRSARLHYFNQEQQAAEGLLLKDQAITRVYGSLASLDAEDAISEDTLYRTVFGLDPYAPNQGGHPDLITFSYKSANCRKERAPGQSSSSTSDLNGEDTRIGYEAESDAEDNAGCNMAILAVAPVRIVFLQQFALECVDYLLAGMLGAAVSGGIARAKTFVKDKLLVTSPLETSNVNELSSTRTAICLDLNSPRLMLPSNCKSFVRLEASLSCIKVRTQFNARTVTLQKPRTSSTDAPIDSQHSADADADDDDTSHAAPMSGTETIWMRALHADVVDLDIRAADASPLSTTCSIDVDPMKDEYMKNTIESRQSLTAKPVCVSVKVTNPLDSERAAVLDDIYGVAGISGTKVEGNMSRLTVTLDDVRYQILAAVAMGNFGDSHRHGHKASHDLADGPRRSIGDDNGEESDSSSGSHTDDEFEEKDDVAVQFNYGNSAAPVAALSSTLRLEGVGIDFYFTGNENTATSSTKDSSLNTSPSLSLSLDTVALTSERTTRGHSQLDLEVRLKPFFCAHTA